MAGSSGDDQERAAMLKERRTYVKIMISKNSERDMEKKIMKLVVYFLNLVFGRGKQADYFWDEIVVKRCSQKFDLAAAEKYYEELEAQMGTQGENEDNEEHANAEVFRREHVNKNALFFALVELIGLRHVGEAAEDSSSDS